MKTETRNERTAQRAIPTSVSESQQRTARRTVPTANQRVEFLDCGNGVFPRADWEREREQWRTLLAVVLTVAIAGWATVAAILLMQN